MIRDYFTNYFARLRVTKNIAHNKNVGTWVMPFIDSLLLLALVASQISLGIWFVLDTWQNSQDYIPSYMVTLWELSTLSFASSMLLLMFTILDRVIILFIYVHYFAGKLVFKTINKLDMYLWRRTGKDSMISNFLLKIQERYMKRSKKQRKLLGMVFIGVIVSYYGWLILT